MTILIFCGHWRSYNAAFDVVGTVPGIFMPVDNFLVEDVDTVPVVDLVVLVFVVGIGFFFVVVAVFDVLVVVDVIA